MLVSIIVWTLAVIVGAVVILWLLKWLLTWMVNRERNVS